MPTLLLRLVAPMQSWGVSSRFTVRDTVREPTKSGVVGIIAAALGRPRTTPIDDLAALRMGVRIDRPGKMEMDYHTAQNVYKASGGVKPTEVSRRYYLADAAFLVGMESDDVGQLEHIQRALRSPRWPLYLGRKAFVPAEPIWLEDGLQQQPLLPALKAYPWLGHDPEAYQALQNLRVVLDDPDGAIVRYDLPLSFRWDKRSYAPRRVKSVFIPKPPFRDALYTEEVT